MVRKGQLEEECFCWVWRSGKPPLPVKGTAEISEPWCWPSDPLLIALEAVNDPNTEDEEEE
jgi:hypothetical protein